MPPRIPTPADFAPLSSSLPLSLHFPSPPESTTTILILLHGLGDHEAPFASFARNLSLPGVLAISVRGTAPLPLPPPGDDDDGHLHFHWGDDLVLDQRTGEVDPADAGFETAARRLLDELVEGVLVRTCGWEMGDVLFFGFGQGGSLALGLASRLRTIDVSEDKTKKEERKKNRKKLGKICKGVVSIGGPLPCSMIPSLSSSSSSNSSSRDNKSATPVLVCQLGRDEADAVEAEFRDVRVVNWRRREVAMPRDREEVFPIMKFFADQLNRGWK